MVDLYSLGASVIFWLGDEGRLAKGGSGPADVGRFGGRDGWLPENFKSGIPDLMGGVGI